MKKLLLLILVLCSVNHLSKAQKITHTNSLKGKWIYASSSQKNLGTIPQNQLPDLVFDDAAKTVSGLMGCNRMNGSYVTEGDQLTFGTMINTNKACEDMQVEQYISSFLINVGWYKIKEDKLYLYDKMDKGKYLIYKRNNIA